MDHLMPLNDVTVFTLLVLTQNPYLQKILFIVFLFLFLLTVLTKLFIVHTISLSPILSAPMDCFLTYLSFIDVSYTSVTTPKMVIDLLYQKRSISLSGCPTQLFLEHFLRGSETLCLVVMAYDFYVPIGKPLHYVTIVQQSLGPLVIMTWIGGILHATVQILFMINFTFCGLNIIDYFMCDLFPLLKFACSDMYMLGMVVVNNSGAMCLLILSMLLIFCAVILHPLKSHGPTGWCKSLSTYGSQFTVVVLFFVACIFIYMHLMVSDSVDRLVTVFFATLASMLNPFIYTVRNTEVKNAVRNFLKARKT